VTLDRTTARYSEHNSGQNFAAISNCDFFHLQERRKRSKTVSEPGDLPRIPEHRIEPSPRKLDGLKPGQRVVLNLISNIQMDEEGHVWVDLSSEVLSIPLVPGLSLRAERTERGFILWLDQEVKFRRGRRRKGREYLPVVEFREAPEDPKEED
jgi:hypothetical protein